MVRSPAAPRLLRLACGVGSWLMPEATVRRASHLFGAPLPSSRSRALAADAGDAAFGHVHSEGQALATYVWGDPARQPYVLFSHGWSSFGLRCRPWVAPLREAGYAVVAFDHPGHGRNQGGRAILPAFAAALAAVARRHGDPAALVGHSMGGAAAMLALSAGLRAERVVLVAPAADLRAAGGRFGRAIGLAPALVARMFEGFERQIGLPVDSFSAHLHAPRLGAPALVVHDLEDDDVPWEEGERYARLWPGARLLTTTGLGHHRIAGEPRVIEVALRFLRGEAVGERVVSSPNLPFGFG
ncbi:hydrolase [Pseudoxanthomonas suwonensis]|uniref:Hydrolase n=1 Tax=Pseudoxanthomonas suwonensis TaxID=314722 RepID=A0A0E3Z3I1_9GAMM|nr:hydrolase [Pseudoxanthomonas suwonensis]